MFNVILYEPEIPPNTGNVIRLCANTGATLHLIRPLGFELNDAKLRRAGLDYHEFTALRVHENLAACLQTLPDARLFAYTTKSKNPYHLACYQAGDMLLFGPESRGLPADILAMVPPSQRLLIPMLPHSRSLNLSNTVAVAMYEAWRQCGFSGTN
jgi:tRNA (cytidine/uridine-2'-O-)-methyltransferase